MTVLARDRHAAAPHLHRPAVVELVDTPRSTSGGRTVSLSGALVSQVLRFGTIGVVSTIAWAALFAALRGAGLGSVAANGIALVVTAIGNTAANRRLTFGVTGRAGLVRDHGAGLLAFGLALGLTTATAAALDWLAPDATRIVELAVLAAANAVATGGRFVLLRSWIGRASPLPVT